MRLRKRFGGQESAACNSRSKRNYNTTNQKPELTPGLRGLASYAFRSQTRSRPSPMSESPNLMEAIVALAKRRGFVFPSSEIYGERAVSITDAGPS